MAAIISNSKRFPNKLYNSNVIIDKNNGNLGNQSPKPLPPKLEKMEKQKLSPVTLKEISDDYKFTVIIYSYITIFQN